MWASLPVREFGGGMRGPAVLAIGLLLTACGGAGTPTTVAIESATSSSVTVETTTTTAAILEGIDSLSASAAPYDGTWAGTTSEGEDIVFTIESRAVTFVVIGFTSDECAEDSPMSAQAFGTPLGAVEGGKLTARLAGLYVAEINGSFTSESTAAGDVTLQLGSRCGGVRALTWAADLLAEGDPLPGSDEWFGQTPPNGVLPDLSIPDHLYDTTGGASNFDQQSGVFETDGVWYLVGSQMESFIPVPSGWTTEEDGSNTLFMFSEELDLVIGFDSFEGTPEGYVLLGVDGFEGDDRSAQEALDSVVTEMTAGGFEIMASEVVDESRAYFVARQDSTLFLGVLSQNPARGWYHTLISVFDDRAQWDEYYPIVRAMIEGWYGLYDNPLGFSLPADLN